jgi:hypothetical protein
METTRRRLARSALVIAVSALVLGTALRVSRDLLFGAGPAAVHDLASAQADIRVCGRTYHGGTTIRSLDSIRQDGGPLSLVDPAPLAPCPPPNPDGSKPCSNLANGACATVVYVRVGLDAYAEYALRGGP